MKQTCRRSSRDWIRLQARSGVNNTDCRLSAGTLSDQDDGLFSPSSGCRTIKIRELNQQPNLMQKRVRRASGLVCVLFPAYVFPWPQSSDLSRPHPKVQIRHLGATRATFLLSPLVWMCLCTGWECKANKQNIVHMVIGPPTGYTALYMQELSRHMWSEKRWLHTRAAGPKSGPAAKKQKQNIKHKCISQNQSLVTCHQLSRTFLAS